MRLSTSGQAEDLFREKCADASPATPRSTTGGDGVVRLEEAPRVLHDLVDVLWRILPGIDGHLRVRPETGDLHRDLLRVPGHIVRRDHHRLLDGAAGSR